MAAIVNTSKSVLGQISPAAVLLAVSGDTLTYIKDSGQELILFNTDTVSRTVTIDGSAGTTVLVPGAGTQTVSVASGVTYTIAADSYAVVRLDTITAYLQGTVSIVADTAAKVSACIIK